MATDEETTMFIHKSTLAELEKRKHHPKESYEEVIKRELNIENKRT